jgi:ubiquinone/menaquinone biosynthesis C-methylase UbiE
VDISPAMCTRLRRNLDCAAIGNVGVLTDTATALPLADGSVDAVISNYCLHHLGDDAKRQALAEIARVLRPGGRLVFADMMFNLDLIDRRNRAVIALLLKRVLRHGPAGIARLAKNATRIATGRWEHPATVEWWRQELHLAGFTAVSVQALEHEGGIACACAPLHPAGMGEQPPRSALGDTILRPGVLIGRGRR